MKIEQPREVTALHRLLLFFIPVLLKINLTQWVSFSCLWPITCHVQNYYDILQFWGFSPKQELPTYFGLCRNLGLVIEL
jgi:hypothetical protein